MNFFQRQDVARRKIGLLLMYFVICTLLIIASVYFVTIGFAHHFNYYRLPESSYLWEPRIFIGVAISIAIIITIGSIYKVLVLNKGGSVVATMMGGTLVNPNSGDLQKRKLLNVVEEMAIASGTPVPPVYVMENEQGINAFAAGFTPGSAVICVTKGCMNVLSRDELQGVIAHEFSHIINGDMRLNIKLMGMIHGILVIAIIGRIFMRTRGKKNPLPLLGLGLLLIGYIGVLFGRLIKAAISRQREFLSDASAVQFTRNPDGIAGALKKIGGLSFGSKLATARADEASHIFFSNGLGKSFLDMLSTHPDLAVRIKCIDPSFDGKFPEVSADVKVSTVETTKAIHSVNGDRFQANPAQILNKIGELNGKNVIFASALLSAMSPLLKDHVREPFGARAVIYAMLVNSEHDVETGQLKLLESKADAAVYQETIKVLPQVRQLGPEYRLPLIDMALPALKNLSDDQYAAFRKNVGDLVDADDKRDLFEFILEKILRKHLEPCFARVKPPTVKYKQIFNLRSESQSLLSVVALSGHDEHRDAIKSFDAGKVKFGLGENPFEILPDEKCTLKSLNTALDKFAESTPAIKEKALDAVITCITSDDKITVEESELIRAIADTLDCPIPPLDV